MKRLIIVDGHNLLFRMFYGIPASIKNKSGIEMRGVYGFMGTIKRLASELDPYSILVIFDSETSKNANASLLDTYKANRPDYSLIPDADNPFSSLPIIKKCLDCLGIFHYEVHDNEADDYIASIATKTRETFDSIIIISNDSDFFQLIDEKIHIYSMRGKNHILYDYKAFYEKFHINPQDYILYKSLIGDSSDNIKGVKGIGHVTAVNIISYPSMIEYICKTPRLLNMLKENESLIKRNIALITLAKNLDISPVRIEPLDERVASKKVRDLLYEIDEI